MQSKNWFHVSQSGIYYIWKGKFSPCYYFVVWRDRTIDPSGRKDVSMYYFRPGRMRITIVYGSLYEFGSHSPQHIPFLVCFVKKESNILPTGPSPSLSSIVFFQEKRG